MTKVKDKSEYGVLSSSCQQMAMSQLKSKTRYNNYPFNKKDGGVWGCF